ncbi:hypothetical protein ERX35_001015 [Macrococcus equipercicus]|uniref:Uncharacterized protein n=1 Tax=Macrococcus equipercicus TaxID=69967 RepID=A0ABQ6RBB9_9STAP|nr:hypothetical protein [Macrococcus equipercicus]KAA1042493.1 hypothetical protein ERX35_001015 [Macrococcus equipercicus]
MADKYLSKANHAKASRLNKQHLSPKKVSKKKFEYNSKSLISIDISEYEFTNFLSEETKHGASNRFYYLLNNEHECLLTEDFNESENIIKSIKGIISDIYDTESDSKLFAALDSTESEQPFFKARVKDNVGNSTSFRVFYYLNKDKNAYEIILIDPLHLAIKSRVQYKKPNRYEDMKTNSICISSIYREVKVRKTFI